jgi:hypothetical protein
MIIWPADQMFEHLPNIMASGTRWLPDISYIYMYIPFLGEVQYHLAVSSKLLDVLEKISREMEREHGKERRRIWCILLWRERQMCISAHR